MDQRCVFVPNHDGSVVVVRPVELGTSGRTSRSGLRTAQFWTARPAWSSPDVSGQTQPILGWDFLGKVGMLGNVKGSMSQVYNLIYSYIYILY